MAVLLPVAHSNLDSFAAESGVSAMPHRHILSVQHDQGFLFHLDLSLTRVQVINLIEDVILIHKIVHSCRLDSALQTFIGAFKLLKAVFLNKVPYDLLLLGWAFFLARLGVLPCFEITA